MTPSHAWQHPTGAGRPIRADDTPVSAVMTASVICVHREVSVEELTALFLDKGISGAPVIDSDGKVVGVISKTDLVREQRDGDTLEIREAPRTGAPRSYTPAVEPGFHVERLARATVGEIMTPVALTLTESASIAQAAALMAFEGVHRVPVVGIGGKVTGILSAIDVLRWLAEQSGYLARR